MAYSADGKTWTKIAAGSGAGKSRFASDKGILSIVYANGLFVAGGNGPTVVYSAPQE
jgi:hypothetical protein